MYIISSPYMDKLFNQLIGELPMIERIDSIGSHFIKKEAVYLIDEISHTEIDLLKSNGCKVKIFTDKKDMHDGIYKFQSVHKILHQLEIPMNSWILVVGYQLDRSIFNGVIESTKKLSTSTYVFDLTLSEVQNFNLYDYKLSIDNKTPLVIGPTDEPIRMFTSIKDYAMPPLDLFQTLFNSFSFENEVIIFTESIKNPVDLYVLNHSKRIFILSNPMNSYSKKYMEQVSLGLSSALKIEELSPEDFIQKIRLRRI